MFQEIKTLEFEPSYFSVEVIFCTFKALTKGRGCSAAVEHSPCDQEVEGSNHRDIIQFFSSLTFHSSKS